MRGSHLRPSAIKETSFESLNGVENLFVTGDDRSGVDRSASISNQLNRLSEAAGAGETDQSKISGNMTF